MSSDRNAISKTVPQNTVVVGSKGRMGNMLLARAAKANLTAAGIDKPLLEEDIANACAQAELIILAVPAMAFEEVVLKLKPHLPQGVILADITSVKESPMRIMEKFWSGPVIGTHPLFGPNTDANQDLPVAIVRGKNADENHLQKVTGFFNMIGFRTFETDASTHDKAMAKIQNMNFITNLAYFALLAGQKDLKPFLTPSFERRKLAASKMLTEDAEMFSGLFETNPHSQEVVRQYRKMLNIAASGDIELLCKRAQWWWPQNQAGSKIHSSANKDIETHAMKNGLEQ